MPWTALVYFVLALAAWRFTLQHPNDVGRFLGSLTTLFFGLAGLMAAPLLLQGAALAGLLIYPAPSSSTQRRSLS